MTDGTSQGLFIVVAIVIFGIFTLMAYILFEDTLSPALASMFTDVTEKSLKSVKNEYILVETINKEVLIDTGYKNEFTRFEDIAYIFDEHGLGTYRFVFDLKSTKEPGKIRFYFQNGSGSRYALNTHAILDVDTDYETFTVTRTILNNDMTDSRATISFFGTYGTGVMPAIKNMSIYKLVE